MDGEIEFGPDRRSLFGPARAAMDFFLRQTGGSIDNSTFYRWLQCGKIDSIRLGRSIFVSRPDLRDAIRRSRDGEML